MPVLSAQRTFRCFGPISTAPVVADVDGDGQPEIVVVADALYVWRGDGTSLPGFPVRGQNAFASRPAVVDVNKDGRNEIVVGCDDNRVYVVDIRGRALPGWPAETGGDVYSSPAVADIDGDGRWEIVVGSDDGRVYAWRADGSPVRGWPQETAGFVASSPKVADVDGDGRPEVVVGSWDGRVYIWRGDGTRLQGWPRQTGHFVWATPAVADVDGDGRAEVFVASDRVYGWHADGTPLAGWPRQIDSYAVAAPLLMDLDGDAHLEVVQVADKIYVWRVDGSSVPGFPVDLGTFIWATPAHLPPQHLVVTGWDGGIYAVQGDGHARRFGQIAAPLFASPVLADLDGNGHQTLLVAGWNGRVRAYNTPSHVLPEDEGGANDMPDPGNTTPHAGGWPTIWVREHPGPVGHAPAGQAPFVVFPFLSASRAVMWYRPRATNAWHPVPLVRHRGHLTGLIQPFPRGMDVEFFVYAYPTAVDIAPHLPGHRVSYVPEMTGALRYPRAGVWHVRFTEPWHARARRWWRRLRHAH